MISLRLAKNSGFCFGVKRAINIAEQTCYDGEKAVTLGPIIHNPQMVRKLESEGIECVEAIEQIGNRKAIIRSHGITKDKLELLKKRNISIVDATCPYVSKAQELAGKLSSEGYFVVILGDPKHPEVQAISSYVPGEFYIVDPYSELDKSEIFSKKVGIVCQTTQKEDNLLKLVNSLTIFTNELRIFNTICNATSIRQNSTRRLAKDTDVMIVIGGRNSSNTKMLAKICSEHTETYHIETCEEITEEMLENKKSIGLTAGASTPDWIIINVHNKILEMSGNSKGSKAINVEDIPVY